MFTMDTRERKQPEGRGFMGQAWMIAAVCTTLMYSF